MKRLSRTLIIVLLLNMLFPLTGVSQQSNAILGEQLREQIAKLERIERDPATPPEVKELNRSFLLKRRAQLRAILKKRIGALETYLLMSGAFLSEQEVQTVKDSIQNLKHDARNLEDTISAPDARVEEESPSSYSISNIATSSAVPKEPLATNVLAVDDSVSPDCDTTLSDGDDVTYTVAKPLLQSHADAIQANRDRIPSNRVKTLINDTLYEKGGGPENGDYSIVHIIEWGTVDGKAEAIREHWTLYKYVEDDWKVQSTQKGTRIFGQRRVHILAIHLKVGDTWDINYTVSVKKKTPTNVANVLDLLSVVTSGKVSAKKASESPRWGGGLMCIGALPSDLEVQGEVVVRNSDSVAIQQPKTYNKTYDNEGKYMWDVSIGVPMKEVKSVQFNADDGTVRTKEVNKQNAYGFLNIFPVPVDLKSDTFLKVPHLVFGVPLSKKPLDSPVIGLGYGIRKFSIKFDLFAGAVFNRVREPRTLNAGDAATGAQLESDLRSRRITKFIFGVNLPLRQVKEALTK